MKVAVYGANGHTGRFVIEELLRRGHAAIAVGRDRSKLEALFADRPGVESRAASLDSPESLDAALKGAAAVIHCAGPFLDTASPVIEAALRARIHYFDVTAEQGSALATFETFDDAARERGVAIVPASGFYGGFADVIASAAVSDWHEIDRIDVAIALDSWKPTRGTRVTGERNTAQRLVLKDGTLAPLSAAAGSVWQFDEPFGTQNVIEIPFTETILISRHLRVSDVHNYLNEAPLRDVRDAGTPEPVAADERGRSDQEFLLDVVARRQGEQRRRTVRGRDIYAITAPIVVEAMERVSALPVTPRGTFALAEVVDPKSFLESLAASGEITYTSSCHTTDAIFQPDGI